LDVLAHRAIRKKQITAETQRRGEEKAEETSPQEDYGMEALHGSENIFVFIHVIP
jgi:hypothetical protein